MRVSLYPVNKVAKVQRAWQTFVANPLKKAGISPALFALRNKCAKSVGRDDRAAPVEAVVDARLHHMVVGGEAAERHERGGRREGRLASVFPGHLKRAN